MSHKFYEQLSDYERHSLIDNQSNLTFTVFRFLLINTAVFRTKLFHCNTQAINKYSLNIPVCIQGVDNFCICGNSNSKQGIFGHFYQ